MNNCKDCKYALWNRTAAGKLHPSGEGRCNYQWKMPELPVAFHWISRTTPSGGAIQRKRDNEEHCVYWDQK